MNLKSLKIFSQNIHKNYLLLDIPSSTSEEGKIIVEAPSHSTCVQEYTKSLESLWNKYSKYIKITKHSKV